ncbi:MAG TPA: NAD-dependent deacylase [Candidatus Omnitrophota bacterium]|nr:NAD-dependent deacylase [Candidatus Omnitrophota bacterium]
MTKANFDFEIKELRKLIAGSSKIAFFTGAGISTESGISDYRSQGGVYERYRPVTIQEFLADEESRKEFWRRKKEFYQQHKKAAPNAAHLAIASLEKQGKIAGVITQNIDGLHQAAGSQKVFEIHGTNMETICLSCSDTAPYPATFQKLLRGIEIPLCEKCGGLLKTNTISFGQELNADTLQRSFMLARNCDLMIAVGSSLVVEPAASIPRRAKESGASLVIINRETTPLYTVADLSIGASAGDILRQACF